MAAACPRGKGSRRESTLRIRRSQGERLFYGAIKDNYGDAKLLEACDRVWRGKPEVPQARAMWRSLFPAAAKVEVANAWLCERV